MERTDHRIELARQSRLKTLALLGAGVALGLLFAWVGQTWDHVPYRLRGTGRESEYLARQEILWLGMGTVIIAIVVWKNGLAAARALLGGPALFVSGGRLVYLFGSLRSWPLSSITAVGLQTVRFWGPIFLRIDFKDRSPLQINMTLLRNKRQDVLDRCAAAGLPMRQDVSSADTFEGY